MSAKFPIRFLVQLSNVFAKLRGAKIGERTILSPGYDWLLVSWKSVKIGKDVRIGRRAWIQVVKGSPGRILIGDRCAIGRDTVISSAFSIEVGDDCLISYRVSILDHDHQFEYGLSPVSSLVGANGAVFIGARTFIGANSMILKGVSIGENSIVGAGSIVTKSFPPSSVVGGNPAVLLATRTGM
jgi:acetyltransferase-like isoleucine patch superfamily enzyme